MPTTRKNFPTTAAVFFTTEEEYRTYRKFVDTALKEKGLTFSKYVRASIKRDWTNYQKARK